MFTLIDDCSECGFEAPVRLADIGLEVHGQLVAGGRHRPGGLVAAVAHGAVHGAVVHHHHRVVGAVTPSLHIQALEPKLDPLGTSIDHCKRAMWCSKTPEIQGRTTCPGEVMIIH